VSRGVPEPEDFERLLEKSLPRFGLDMPRSAIAALASYLEELDRWRQKINLTGRLSRADMAEHALESAFASDLIPHSTRVIDIGSGAGFPAVPIAICRPDASVTMVEPRAKRTSFLGHIVRTLDLANAEVLRKDARGVSRLDWAVATTRAVGDLSGVIGDAPFLAPRGLLLAWTTEPERLARELGRALSLEAVRAIPSSERRAIAIFRKR
jgi:16S rRNA (guanine527-N7)-methyltransferase